METSNTMFEVITCSLCTWKVITGINLVNAAHILEWKASWISVTLGNSLKRGLGVNIELG